MNINEPLNLFLIRGAGTGKIFRAKAIFQMLMQIYNEHYNIEPLKPKGLILAYTGKVAYNASGVTIHFALLIPFNKSSFISLRNEVLENLKIFYRELRVVLTNEVSLIGSRFLYQIDDRLRNIKNIQKKYFGNIDIIFYANLYQAQPIQDSLIF